MTASTGARRRLARLMDVRRAELRDRWDDVASRGHISVATLRRIRNSDVEITVDNEVGIEDGLRWTRGSVATILAGGDPTPLADESEPVDPEDRVWDALRVKYEAWRAADGPDAAWAMLRRDATEDIRLIDERRRRHAERDRRDVG